MGKANGVVYYCFTPIIVGSCVFVPFFQIIGSLGRPPEFGLMSSAHWDDDFKHAEGVNPGWMV